MTLPSINLRREGLLAAGALDGWSAAQHRRVRAGMVKAYRAEAPGVREKLRGMMRSALRVRRPTAANVMTFRIHDRQPHRLPALELGALRGSWLSAHETGATIRGRRGGLLLPFPGVERGKRFRALVDRLFRLGAAHFATVRGRVILFAEHQAEWAKLTRRARGRITRAMGGGRVKKGADVPIAIWVPQVRLTKRLRVQETVRRELPRLMRAVELAISREP